MLHEGLIAPKCKQPHGLVVSTAENDKANLLWELYRTQSDPEIAALKI